MSDYEKAFQAKFDEIAVLVAREQGLAVPSLMADEEHAQLYEEVQELCENWDMAENDSDHGLKVTTELQKLLAECCELSEKIHDEQEEKLGLTMEEDDDTSDE